MENDNLQEIIKQPEVLGLYAKKFILQEAANNEFTS